MRVVSVAIPPTSFDPKSRLSRSRSISTLVASRQGLCFLGRLFTLIDQFRIDYIDFLAAFGFVDALFR